MRLLQDQINQLRSAASYLESLDQKLRYLQDKNPPMIEKQKDVLRGQIKELADKYADVMRHITSDQDVQAIRRNDTVTVSEDYPWHPNEAL